MEKLPKREHPVERIIGFGFDEADYKIARAFWERVFKQQESFRNEREKTAEEEAIISWVNEETNALLEHYGARPLDVLPQKVHIFSEENWPQDEMFKKVAAFHHLETQSLVVRSMPQLSLFAYRLYHEMLHIKAHQAMQYFEEDGKQRVEAYRLGLGLSSKKRDNFELQFRRLNESIIESLAVAFWQEKIEQDPRFQEEMKEVQRIRAIAYDKLKASEKANTYSDEQMREIANEVCAALPGQGEEEPIYFGYPMERAALSILIDKLVSKNKLDYKDVFDLFVRSMLRGHMAELGKLIDRTFGQGTFKRLGEISSSKHSPQEFVDFVKSLE
jgi:hypothetical protein